MALWDVEGASTGSYVTPTVLPVFERSGGTPGAAAWSLTVDPTFEGNLWTDPKDDEPVFQVGSYHGQESLLCGGEPCNKVYWNVVVGFDPTVPDCRLEWEATAASAPGLTNGQTDKATVYPFLQGNVQLTSSAKEGATASLVCRQNPLNGGGGLGTEYTTPGVPHTFCSATDGDRMWTVDGCTWSGIPGGGGGGGGDPTPVEPDGAAIDPGTIETGEGDTVSVTVTNRFWIVETEVTIGEWKALSGGIDPSGFPGACGTDDCPVNLVSWWSSTGYLNALSIEQGLAPCFDLTQATNCTGTWQDGSLLCDGSPSIIAATLFDCEGYRLPTEGEWELAARAGTTTQTYGGNRNSDPVCPKLSGAGAFLADTPLADLAWYDCNSMSSTHKVRGKAPNSRGLYDMLGNVWEWVYDWYGSYAGTNLTDSTGPVSGVDRIKRGGGYSTLAADVSAPGRGRAAPSQQSLTTGFRSARSILTPTP